MALDGFVSLLFKNALSRYSTDKHCWRSSGVYVCYVEKTRYINRPVHKIGMSSNLDSRIKQLERMHSIITDDVIYIKTRRQSNVETMLHYIFAHKRAEDCFLREREWFYLDGDDLSWLASLQSIDDRPFLAHMKSMWSALYELGLSDDFIARVC